MKTPLILISLLILPSTLYAQDQPPPPPTDRTFAPKMVFTPNELLKYHFVMNMNTSLKTSGSKPLPLPPGMGDIKMEATLRMKTAGVKPDGTAVMVVSASGGKMVAMGNSADIPEGQTQTMEIDRRGGIKQMKFPPNVQAPQALQGLFSGSNFNNLPGFNAVMPDHPVKTGDTWELDSPSPFGPAMHISNTLLGTEMVDGKETLKIKQTVKLPFDMKLGASGIVKDDAQALMVFSGSMGGNSIQNILEANGRIVKSIGEMTGNVVMEMKGEVADQMEKQGYGRTINMDITGSVAMNLLSAGMATPQPKPAAVPAKKPTTKKSKP